MKLEVGDKFYYLDDCEEQVEMTVASTRMVRKGSTYFRVKAGIFIFTTFWRNSNILEALEDGWMWQDVCIEYIKGIK